MSIITSFRAGLAFFTRIPVGSAPLPPTLSGVVAWLPAVGLLVGALAALALLLAARLGLPAPAPELPLTDRDRELARLVAGRCTNKEIAAALYLSEGTVKQYINQLYAKLDIGGAVRNKRAQLAALFGTKY